MSKAQKTSAARILTAAVLLAAELLLPVSGPVSLIICIAAYLVVGAEVVYEAFKELFTQNAIYESLTLTPEEQLILVESVNHLVSSLSKFIRNCAR